MDWLTYSTYKFIIILMLLFWVIVGVCRTLGLAGRFLLTLISSRESIHKQRLSRQRYILGFTFTVFAFLLASVAFPFFAPAVIAPTMKTGITQTIVMQSLMFGGLCGIIGFGWGSLLDRLLAESN